MVETDDVQAHNFPSREEYDAARAASMSRYFLDRDREGVKLVDQEAEERRPMFLGAALLVAFIVLFCLAAKFL